MQHKLRFLASAEYPLVRPILAEYEMPLPYPANSQIVVAQDNVGSVLGLSVLQMVPHLDPVWVTLSERGSKLWERLVEEQLKSLKAQRASGSLFSFVERKGAAELLERKFDFINTNYQVMELKLGGE